VIVADETVTTPKTRPWPYAAAACAAIIAFLYLVVWGRRYGLDLMVYRDSVRAWESGYNPYHRTFTGHRLPFAYPPFALAVLSPLGWLSFLISQWLVWVASIAAATGSVLLVLRDRGIKLTRRTLCYAFAWSCLSIIVLEPARSGIDYGQIEFILMFLAVADLLAAPSRYRGILVGLAAAVKLTPLVFILFLAVARDVRSVMRSTASFVVCTGLSWFFWPGLSRIFWFQDLSNPSRLGSVIYGGNQSWYAVLHRPPFPATGSEVAWLLLSIVTAAASGFVAWRCLQANEKAFGIVAVGLAGLMISPISWTHHWVLVLLIPALIIRPSSVVPRTVRTLLWGLIAVTVVAPYWWFSRGTPADIFGAILPIWTGLLLVVWAVIEFRAWRADTAASQCGLRGGTSPVRQK
jgi:alpha-1,2-mannosyltransferase